MSARTTVWRFFAILVMLVCVPSARPEDGQCDIPDVGAMTPGDFKFKAGATHYWQGALNGVETENSDRFAGLYDIDLMYLIMGEPEPAGDYAVLVVSTQASFGGGVEGKAGSFFDLNDGAKGDHDFFLDAVFVELGTFDRTLTWHLGKMDMQDFFDASAVAGECKTQFFAFPLMHNLTIPWPDKGLAAVVTYESDPSWYLRAGVADAQAAKRETGFNTAFHGEDALVGYGEFGLRPRFRDMEGTYRFTAWYDSSEKARRDGAGTEQGDAGFAVSFDQQISDRTTLFFRYGWADDRLNEVEDFISFGGDVREPLPGRPDDTFGVAWAHALRSPEGLAADQERGLDLIEAYYRIQVADTITFSPNVQVLMDPGGEEGQSPATIVGARLRLTF